MQYGLKVDGVVLFIGSAEDTESLRLNCIKRGTPHVVMERDDADSDWFICTTPLDR